MYVSHASLSPQSFDLIFTAEFLLNFYNWPDSIGFMDEDPLTSLHSTPLCPALPFADYNLFDTIFMAFACGAWESSLGRNLYVPPKHFGFCYGQLSAKGLTHI